VIPKEDAEAILTPWKADIRETMFYGWNAFLRLKDADAEFCATVMPRTRAGIVHDFAIKKARSIFEGQESKGIRTRAEFGSLLVVFDEKLVLRIKKFGEGERANNSRTTRQERFDRQCLELPGIPPEATKVTAGYKLNDEQTEIVRIAVSCWCVNSHVWSIGVWEADDGNMLLNFPEPEPIVPTQPARKTIVRPKGDEKQAEGEV
jgi:hypothetical protein